MVGLEGEGKGSFREGEEPYEKGLSVRVGGPSASKLEGQEKRSTEKERKGGFFLRKGGGKAALSAGGVQDYRSMHSKRRKGVRGMIHKGGRGLLEKGGGKKRGGGKNWPGALGGGVGGEKRDLSQKVGERERMSHRKGGPKRKRMGEKKQPPGGARG